MDDTLSRRRRLLPDAVAALLIFALNIIFVLPYCLTAFSSELWNNDYLYISIARMFGERPWTWNSLQYGGAPLQYLYPPLMPLLINAVPAASLGLAFHMVSAAGYALVPVALYVLCRQIFRSRAVALFIAFAYGVLPSPVYWALPAWNHLAAGYHHAPWGFIALTVYSEAAHPFSTAAALFAVAAAWKERWTLASALGAAALLFNWAGAVAFTMALAAFAVARARRHGAVESLLRALGVGGIAYGLAAFWMTAGFFNATRLLDRVVLRHEQGAAAPWSSATWAIIAGAALPLCGLLWKRIPEAWAFALALAVTTGIAPLAYTALGNHVLPLPHRYVLEFNIALLLGAGCALDALGRWRTLAIGVVCAAGLIASGDFLLRAWQIPPKAADPTLSETYRIAQWLGRNGGGGQVLAAGELEGALNIWTDAPQIGGSHQGLSNPLIAAAHRQITLGCDASPQASELWLKALGVRYVVTHSAASREHFHWWVNPERFASLTPVWTNDGGDAIYALPDLPQATVVDAQTLDHLGPIRSTADAQYLERYVQWAAGKRPAQIRWDGPGRATIDANLGPGDAILVKTNYDRGWKAPGGAEPDPIGFLLLRPPAGVRRIDLRFGAAWDVWLGRALTLAAICAIAFGISRRSRLLHGAAGIALILPAVIAYAAIARDTPRITAAEQAYRRIQPPLINAGGIVGFAGNVPPLTRGQGFTVYGLNFGSAHDGVQLTVNGRPAELVSRGPNQVSAMMPADAASPAEIRVTVNGCTGNAFAVDARAK